MAAQALPKVNIADDCVRFLESFPDKEGKNISPVLTFDGEPVEEVQPNGVVDVELPRQARSVLGNYKRDRLTAGDIHEALNLRFDSPGAEKAYGAARTHIQETVANIAITQKEAAHLAAEINSKENWSRRAYGALTALGTLLCVVVTPYLGIAAIIASMYFYFKFQDKIDNWFVKPKSRAKLADHYAKNKMLHTRLRQAFIALAHTVDDIKKTLEGPNMWRPQLKLPRKARLKKSRIQTGLR